MSCIQILILSQHIPVRLVLRVYYAFMKAKQLYLCCLVIYYLYSRPNNIGNSRMQNIFDLLSKCEFFQ